MTPDALLTSLDGPALHLIQIGIDALENTKLRLSAAHPASVIRTVRGKKSRTVSAFFDEVSAALQFPYYFGENWAAFDEMIVDLEWLVGDAYLLMIPDGDL